MSTQDKMEKLVDWGLKCRGESPNKDFNYWMGYIEGIIDAAGINGIVIPRSRIFLTSEAYKEVLVGGERP